jgi:hypothetical protein
MDANAIQKLYEVCKVSLSEKGPLSSESVDNVRAVLGMNCLQFLFGSDDYISLGTSHIKDAKSI